MRRFLDHWRPDLALFAESEIWPNTVLEIEARGVPLVLVNGRISDRTFRRWQRLPTMIGALLGRYDLCLAQSAVDAERLAHLGAPRVAVSGNLNSTRRRLADPRTVAQLSGWWPAGRSGSRPARIRGEDEIVLAAHQALAARWPGFSP
jgi:3-deoxy-D-manno-octulosonic-acid transferase